jgi:hypothetical protein
MVQTENDVRKELDSLLENIKGLKDTIDIPSIIDEYIEQGYNVRDYIHKYNIAVQQFHSKE